ncbi:DUF4019 domain-containing protein [Methylomonas sp. HW2-6]|uniref:DUF4019 domain-containing protein n=1 Tax=Methylomonas sp. HW2-6 TaxID=3376687 RepID=UPI004043705B
MIEENSKNWQTIAAFAFGVIFVSAILTIAFFRPNPTAFEYTIFRIVIALAAAGVGAVLPGFLNVSFKNLLRAGGALALFIIVYFFSPVLPAQVEVSIEEPTGDAKVISDFWLKVVDDMHYPEAYESMAADFKKTYPYKQFEEVLVKERRYLDKVLNRQFISSTPYKNPPGAISGFYRQYVYKTTFSGDKEPIYEVIWVFGESTSWKVSGFNTLVKSSSGQFFPFEVPEAAAKNKAN